MPPIHPNPRVRRVPPHLRPPAGGRAPSPRPTRRAGRRRGLTLIEVLVVVAILVVLASLIIAVIPRMRAAARRSTAQQQLSALQHAVDQYALDFRAYPGPLSDATVLTGSGAPSNLGTGARPTMSENLCLALVGGLATTASGTTFDANRVGTGATNLSLATGSPPKTYLDMTVARAMLSPSGRRFTDAGDRKANDTIMPEFVDAFEDPLPILYLRARPGAPGIMSDANTPGQGKAYQYDLRQIDAYTGTAIGTPPGKSHGLRTLGSDPIPDFAGPAPSPALPYFRQPGTATTNAAGAPRQKDRYILIGAGPDRLYGTADDITSFGPVQ